MKRRFITGFSAALLAASAVVPVTNNLIANSPARVQQVAAATADQTAFLNTAAKQAQKEAKRYGLYPSVMIAQAIVESNWGKSGLAVNANNLFGMKADDHWTGATYSSKTREEGKTGNSYYVVAKFRKYPSYLESFDDNGKKLRKGVSWQPERYKGAWLENAASYRDATKALTGTYATDSRYNTTLNSRIENYDLTQFDPQVSNTSKSYVVKTSGATYAWPTDHAISAKTGSIAAGDSVTVTKTITFYNGTKRMYIAGKGWVNDTALDAGSALPPASKKPSESSDVVEKADKTLMHNAYVYNSKGVRVMGMKALKSGSSGTVITTYGTKKINGKQYYRVGIDQYIARGNIDGTVRLLKHNAYVYNEYGNRDNTTVLKKNGSVATFGSAITINGKKYYRTGAHQYVKKGNF